MLSFTDSQKKIISILIIIGAMPFTFGLIKLVEGLDPFHIDEDIVRQVVIPQDIREELHAGEGTIFSVISEKDTVVLKKIRTPSKEELIRELKIMAKEGSKRAKRLGIKESDVTDLLHKSRSTK